MNIKVKKLAEGAKLPAYAHPGDAGMDLFALEDTVFAPDEVGAVKTGVALEIPHGYVGLVWDKSSIAGREGLKILGGVFDAGYRGEIIISLINLSKKAYTFQAGHKIAQMLIQKIEQPELVEVAELSDSSRGLGRFGSTGK